jgi:hypothetical protein
MNAFHVLLNAPDAHFDRASRHFLTFKEPCYRSKAESITNGTIK